jgi:hypothetical protein
MKKSADDEMFDMAVQFVFGCFKIFALILQKLFFFGWRLYREHHHAAFILPPEARFSHSMIIAGSGHGKTQMLQQQILFDIEEVAKGNRSVIVIDSQGDLINNISRLAQIPNDRFVLIDPHDIDHPPALNLFDFGLDRLQGYSALEQEKLMNGAIALYEYLFGALLGADLTYRQGVIFRYLARLMMTIPGCTIHTLIDFMDDPETVRLHLSKLDPVDRRFFEKQFFASTFDSTRQQISTRLWGIVEKRSLARMFANKRNKLNIFTAMNNGSIILINTAKDLLKQDGCEIFGRFFVALICHAVQERAAIPDANKRKPTFIYIDEAQDYFDKSDQNMALLFSQARKQRVGIITANQNLGQLGKSLQDTIMSNTAIKMAGGLNADDTRKLAKEMRCDPEFFEEVRKYKDHSDFACFIRDQMKEPIYLGVRFGAMEQEPKLSEEAYQKRIETNRSRICTEKIDKPKRGEPQTVGVALPDDF